MRQRALYTLAGVLVLAAGLGWALWLYQAAQAEEDRLLAVEEAGGAFHQVAPSQSKRFLHDLEVYGGKANVLMYRFQVWLEELFSGKSLAKIVAVLSLGLAGWCFWTARRRPAPKDEADGGA